MPRADYFCECGAKSCPKQHGGKECPCVAVCSVFGQDDWTGFQACEICADYLRDRGFDVVPFRPNDGE